MTALETLSQSLEPVGNAAERRARAQVNAMITRGSQPTSCSAKQPAEPVKKPKPVTTSPPAEADDLSAEHAMIDRCIEEITPRGKNAYWDCSVDATKLASGKAILDAEPAQMRRRVRAMTDRLIVLERACADYMAKHVKDGQFSGYDGMSPIRAPRMAIQTVLRAALRRKLPLREDDVAALLDWLGSLDQIMPYCDPVLAVLQTVEQFVAANNCGVGSLAPKLQQFGEALRKSYDKTAVREAPRIDRLLRLSPVVAEKSDAAKVPAVKWVDYEPAAVGNADVLVDVKAFLGLIPPRPTDGVEVVGPDQFPLRADSPLREEHEVLTELIAGVVRERHDRAEGRLADQTGKRSTKMAQRDAHRFTLARAERTCATLLGKLDGSDFDTWHAKDLAHGLFSPTLPLDSSITRADAFDFLLAVSAFEAHQWMRLESHLAGLLAMVKKFAGESPLTDGERHVLHRLRCTQIPSPPLDAVSNVVRSITEVLGDQRRFWLEPGDAWAEAINADLQGMKDEQRGPWVDALEHSLSATSARPSTARMKRAKELVSSIGKAKFEKAMRQWLARVPERRLILLMKRYVHDAADINGMMNDGNATCLRGLIWMSTLCDSGELARDAGAVAVSCFRKVRGVGPRAVKVGNAAVFALSQFSSQEALAQLALLKVRIKFGTAQKEIDKALTAAAERLKVPRDEIEEMAVPAYGLESVGVGQEKLGEVTVRISVRGVNDVELEWIKPDGKVAASAPASVKRDFADEIKDLKAAVGDIEKMLPAQRDRIDGLYLQSRKWSLPVWRQRYLDHPLMGVIARRLIWSITVADGKRKADVVWHGDALIDSEGKPAGAFGDDATVKLWHPLDGTPEQVLAWRRRLEALQVVQPFKQAHREIYIVTDAERNTNTYSNRFAAHLLRQHQFNALAAGRGWKNKLRLLVDDTYPPAFRDLPAFQLRAEFWIEGAGDDYGSDTNESGVFNYVSTDQVRFYAISAGVSSAHAGGGAYSVGDQDPVPVERIPPLAFSEIMRDVDLFVGVASVGNDPTWGDRGGNQAQQGMWQRFAFGDLTETAKTRKAVLESLVPRLKIASRCTLKDKFLVVRGQLRTYKIHLGSGNILMEPNDQYLCIVPSRGMGDRVNDRVYLPFEGDGVLAVILSKAFLLAEDDKITDSSIVSQIKP